MTEDSTSRATARAVGRFDRPEKKNALTGAMYEALIEAFDEAERDPSIGALVLSGPGGSSPPATTSAISSPSPSRQRGRLPAGRFTTRLATFEKPLVAAVTGWRSASGRRSAFTATSSTPKTERALPDAVHQSRPRAGGRLVAARAQRFGLRRPPNFCCWASLSTRDGARRSGSSTRSPGRRPCWELAMARRRRSPPSPARRCWRPGACCAATGGPLRADDRGGRGLRRGARPPEARKAFEAFMAGRAEVAGLEHPASSGTLSPTNLLRRDLFIQGYDSQVAWPACYKSPQDPR